jgi:hypothetical protein
LLKNKEGATFTKKSLYKYTKKLIKQSYPKYKRIQAGATLKEIIVRRKRKVGRCIGINTYYHYEHYEERIPMVKLTEVYFNWYLRSNEHIIYVAIDQQNKTVYWNFERNN